MPALLLLEIFFLMLILFIANMSSGITYGVIHKNKVGCLVGFVILNTACIALLIYYGIILTFVIFYTGKGKLKVTNSYFVIQIINHILSRTIY